MRELLWVAVLSDVLLACIYCALPSWGRSKLMFGVTVPDDFRGSAEAKKIAGHYRAGVIGISAVTLLLQIAFLLRYPWTLVGSFLLQSIGTMVLFGMAHSKTMPHRSAGGAVRVTAIAPARPERAGGMVVTLLPYLILGSTALYLALHWTQIPPRFAIHFDFSGRPNGWASRSVFGVYGPLMIAVSIVALLQGIGWGIAHSAARRGETDAAAEWQASFHHATLRLLASLAVLISAMFAYVALLPLWPGSQAYIGWVVLVLFLLIALVSWPLIRMSLSGGSQGDATPDDRWKWGFVYFNPSDPALFVQRRFGIGYTMNMAHRAAWLVLGAVLVLIGGTIFVSSNLQ